MAGFAQTPQPASAPATGLSDIQWIQRVRDHLDDWPSWKTETFTGDGTNGVLGPASGPLRVIQGPINDTDKFGNAALPQISVNGVAKTVITTGTPSAGQVLIDLDTGASIFGTVPPLSQAVTWGYWGVRWRDQKIGDALMEGLHRTWPAIGRYYTDFTTVNRILQWDYQLPLWAQNPETRILDVWYRDPNISIEPWRSLKGQWTRPDLYTIHIYPSQRISLAGAYKITGYGPCLRLADLPPQYFDLPVWWAAGSLLTKKEAPRVRADAMTPQSNEGAAQVGAQAAYGKQLLDEFRTTLKEIRDKTTVPIGTRMSLVSTYKLYPR